MPFRYRVLCYEILILMENSTIIHITGIVQGVGFRPYIYNLAHKYDLRGFCLNDSQGVLIEVQGEMVDKFIQQIKTSPLPFLKLMTLPSE